MIYLLMILNTILLVDLNKNCGIKIPEFVLLEMCPAIINFCIIQPKKNVLVKTN